MKKVIEFSKKKLKETRSVTIYNPVREAFDEKSQDTKKSKKNKKEKKKKDVPNKVDDPKEIEKAAEFASQVTGVRKDFLMGMLVVESDLGRNTGKCTYKEVEEDANNSHEKGLLGEVPWNTFLERREKIKGIAEELGYDYEKLKVSCNPDNYVGTGGALGIPQFMPDTWLDYKEKIASVLGKENPDPWDTRDGVVAMAVKVADVPGVTQKNQWAERAAAKMYLSGTTSWKYDWYANLIFYWSQNYDKVMS
jgi:membrane-bound lytic murein transglycosylase B